MDAIIQCENLVKIYQVGDVEILALQGLDLTVQRGELMGIVGVSGSGKSTLMNVLGSLVDLAVQVAQERTIPARAVMVVTEGTAAPAAAVEVEPVAASTEFISSFHRSHSAMSTSAVAHPAMAGLEVVHPAVGLPTACLVPTDSR